MSFTIRSDLVSSFTGFRQEITSKWPIDADAGQQTWTYLPWCPLFLRLAASLASQNSLQKGSDMQFPKDPPESTPRPPPKLLFNWEDWLPYLADADATDEQKRELIETIWSIVCNFVDLGWEVGDALPLRKKTCGKDIDLKAALQAAMLHSNDNEKESEEA